MSKLSDKLEAKLIEKKYPKTPPMAPKPKPKEETSIVEVKPEEIKIEEPSEISEGDFFIDWDYLVHNSSFQRGFTEFMKHTFPFLKNVKPREGMEVMNQQLQQATQEIEQNKQIIRKFEGIGLSKDMLMEIEAHELFLKQKEKYNKGVRKEVKDVNSLHKPK